MRTSLVLAAALAGCDSNGVSAGVARKPQIFYTAEEIQQMNRLAMAIVHQNLPAIDAEILGGSDPKDLNTLDGQTPLMFAAQMGMPKSVAHVIGRSDVNQLSATGETALIVACANATSPDAIRDRMAVVRELLSHGADPNKRADVRSALMNAAASGSLEMVQALLTAKADPRATRAGRTAAWFSEKSVWQNPEVTALLKSAEGRPL